MFLRVLLTPVVIAGIAITGLILHWALEILIPVLILLFIIGVLTAVSYYNNKKLENTFWQLKELGAYFAHRFAGNSTQSIFTVIEGLFNIDNPGVREWARGCNMSQLIFNDWCNGFTSRIENDSKVQRVNSYISTYLNELWSLVIHYQEFIAQFYEVAEKIEVRQETIEQYNKFVLEYNPFVQRFREYISNLKSVNRTVIEPPSIIMAKELPVKASAQRKPVREPPKHDDNKGYITGRIVA